MAELKTKENNASVEDFINNLPNETVREDCRKIAAMIAGATGAEAKMWGESIVGFGNRTMKYASGRDVEWFVTGFSPRKQNITLYLSTGEAWNEELLSKLGKHKVGMGCLYFKRLSDVNEDVLNQLIEESVARSRS